MGKIKTKHKYCLTHWTTDGHCWIYIGESKTIWKRWATHRSQLKLNRHHCRVLQDLCNRGSRIYYDQLQGFDHLTERETIAYFQSLPGYTVMNTRLT